MPTVANNSPFLPSTSTETTADPSARRVAEPSSTIGDSIENAFFGGLDSVLSGLNSLGIVRPALNAGLRLAASGNDDTWYGAMADHAGTMLEAEYSERGVRKTYDERVK